MNNRAKLGYILGKMKSRRRAGIHFLKEKMNSRAELGYPFFIKMNIYDKREYNYIP